MNRGKITIKRKGRPKGSTKKGTDIDREAKKITMLLPFDETGETIVETSIEKNEQL